MNLSQQSIKNNNQHIRVYVRVRPTNFFKKCLNKHIQMIDTPSTTEIHIKHLQENNKIKKFTFDQVFNKYANQLEVYNAVVAPYIDEVLAGYSCTVFAYGQTGTGKTYTMIGDEKPTVKTTWSEISDIGLIPRSLNHLFCKLRSMNAEFSMRVSYLELYNEELIDLLSTNENSNIKIYDDIHRKGSIIIQGLEEVTVTNTSNVFKLLAKGQEKRKIASTLLNSQSSRSHTIFSILVHMKETNINKTSTSSINTSCSGGTAASCGGFGNGDELLCIGKLNLVDLAGSENISKAGNEKGIRSRETVNINQSLLTLGRVITALVERAPHIPYRQSKLTRLLQESLGGKTKTSIVATIPADQREIEETLSTLEYAYRARHIQNKPEINKKLTKHTLFGEYVEQIERLKCELIASREKNGIYLDRKTYAHLQNRIKSQETELLEQSQLIKALEDDCAKKQKLFDEISFNLYECRKELSLTESTLNDVKSELDYTKSKLSNVKKSSIENEDVLTSQINKSMNATTAAINDSNELHNTMDRRKLSDKKLLIAGNDFNGMMKSYLNDMNINLEKFSESFCNRHRKIQNTFVDDLQPNNDKFFSTTMQSINQLINHQSTDTIKLSQNKYKQLLNSLTVDQQKEFDTFLDELICNETRNNENINRKLSHHLQIIDNFNNLIEHNNNKVSTMFKTYENNVMELIYVQKLNIQKISDHFLQSIDKNLTVISETMQTNSNLEIDLRNALQHIHRLCENSFQNNSKLITLENQLINDRENVHSIQFDSEQYNNPNKFMDTFNRLNNFDSVISGCTSNLNSMSLNATTAIMNNMSTTSPTTTTNSGTITSNPNVLNLDINHNVNQQYELIKNEHQLQYHKMNDTIDNLKKIKIISNVNTNNLSELIGKQMESIENIQEQKSLTLKNDMELIKNSIHGVCDQFIEYKQTNEELIMSSENILDQFINNDLKSHVTTTTVYNIIPEKRQFIHSSKLQHNSTVVNDNNNDDDDNDDDECISSDNTNDDDDNSNNININNSNSNLFHQSLNSINIGEDSSNNIENTFFNTISNCKNSTIYEPNLNYAPSTFGSRSPAIAAALTSSSPTTTMNKQKPAINQMNILDSTKGDNKMQRVG